MTKTKIELRTYQTAAIDAARKAIVEGSKRVLIIAPTGSGKSILAGKIAALAALKSRVLVLCSQSHLIEQNLQKFNAFSDMDAGVYCAQLGRKDTTNQVIFASRDSLGRKPDACGSFNAIILDEAHQLDVAEGTMYQKIVSAQENAWVVGMTGTPWRLSGGRIWGKGRYFERVCYNIGMDVLRNEGFLVPYRFPIVNTKIDTDDIKKTNGDFNLKQLECASSNEAIISGSVQEWLEHEPQMHCTMFFCVTRNHAQKVVRELQKHIPPESIVYVDGDTKDRDTIFTDIRAGKYKAIVSIGTLTTGFDAPIVDCIVMLRATQSTALFVQMCGRGLRPYKDKTHLMILDFADNFKRFGTLEHPMVSSVGLQDNKVSDGSSKDQVKDCPECAAEISFFARECGFCGEIFKLNHSTKAHRLGDVLTPVRMQVISISREPHIKRDSGEQGFVFTWNVILNKRPRTFKEYFLLKRPGTERRYRERLAQMKARITFVTATTNKIFINPVQVETFGAVISV